MKKESRKDAGEGGPDLPFLREKLERDLDRTNESATEMRGAE